MLQHDTILYIYIHAVCKISTSDLLLYNYTLTHSVHLWLASINIFGLTCSVLSTILTSSENISLPTSLFNDQPAVVCEHVHMHMNVNVYGHANVHTAEWVYICVGVHVCLGMCGCNCTSYRYLVLVRPPNMSMCHRSIVWRDVRVKG